MAENKNQKNHDSSAEAIEQTLAANIIMDRQFYGVNKDKNADLMDNDTLIALSTKNES